MKQGIGIPNHILYSYEEEYMPSLTYSDKIKARHFHSTKHLIDCLYAINDGMEELEVKVEDHIDHAMLSNLYITIKE